MTRYTGSGAKLPGMASKPDWKVATSIEVKQGAQVVGTRWHAIGAAWNRTDGSIMLCLDSVPVRSEYVYLFPAVGGPKKREGGQG